jgi:uroporphyrin-III C-methyltransferase/precorrin-2 dehydrogenase/sirohydrochlorin ferrochelatase
LISSSSRIATETMEFLPIFLDLRGQRCLVVGGGEVAERKTSLLLRAGGHVTVVSPRLCQALARRVAEGEVTHHERRYNDGDLAGCRIAFAATDDRGVNAEVSNAARVLNVPVNVADDPSLCSFIMPSIVDRSPVVAAVSTGGASPVLARLIRMRLEQLIPSAYGRLGNFVEGFREQVKARFAAGRERKNFWEKVLQGPIAERVLAGQEPAAHKMMQEALDAPQDALSEGEVYLVGGGPGDPDLLSSKALRLMQQADVVVYDRLVSAPVLDLTRRDAERLYVGKERDRHALPQEEINALLARLAKEGKRVLRLKGGDPFIFGRGGEEIETLMAEGVPFQVVPGITAAAGCASYAGIPLTHRDYSQACLFVTGHLKDGTTDLNWTALAQPNQTVVIYMGLNGLPIICRELQAHGMPPTTPIALVEKGTTPDQKVIIGTLADMPERIASATVRAPTLIIVGEVVRLHEKLAWFDPRG